MSEENKLSFPRRLWLLFFTFAKIAALVVGGGLAMLPVIEDTFSVRKKLLTKDEILDMVTLTQTVPGIIAANSAVYIGMKVAGFAGALCALAGAIFPSFVVIVMIAWFFPGLSPDNPYYLGAFAGVRAGVTGLIVVTAYRMAKKGISGIVEAVAVCVFFLAAMFKLHPAAIIVSGMVFGVVYTMVVKRRIAVPVKGEKS
ncbi:MAG: chromate transporter [Lentisphaeria bacterium]|nr:chromate transporter [Lentisphaeria bacterium]